MAIGDGRARPPTRPKHKTKVKKDDTPYELKSLNAKLKDPKMTKLMDDLQKTYGEKRIFGVNQPMPEVSVIPTGYRILDVDCIGWGNLQKAGLPRKYVTEIYGGESGGKTTFCLGVIANAQKQGNVCAFIDLERSMDGDYARNIGVDTGKWIFLVPKNGDEAAQMGLDCINAGVDLIVIDSFGEMHTEAQVDKELTDNRIMADSTNLINKMLIKCADPLYQNNNVLIAINQIRNKVGAKQWQKQTDSTGGQKLKHKYGLRIEVRGGEKIKKGDMIVGRNMDIKIEKNKIGGPFKTCSLPIMFGIGISLENMLIEDAVRAGVITKKKSWYMIDGTNCNGKPAALAHLNANPDVKGWLEGKVDEFYCPDRDMIDAPPTEDDTTLGEDDMEISLE